MICEFCGKPTILGDKHPQAKVYHLACLMKACTPIRESIANGSHIRNSNQPAEKSAVVSG